MQERWETIEAFPLYKISDQGEVFSSLTEKVLCKSLTKQGHHKVQLMREGIAYTRSVGALVAKTFLEPPPREDFTAIIHLNGDKIDCRAENLMWRPHYSAMAYHEQFMYPYFELTFTHVRDIKTGREYRPIQKAVVEHGLLLKDIQISMSVSYTHLTLPTIYSV